jgi:hypothetical protein
VNSLETCQSDSSTVCNNVTVECSGGVLLSTASRWADATETVLGTEADECMLMVASFIFPLQLARGENLGAVGVTASPTLTAHRQKEQVWPLTVLPFLSLKLMKQY